MVSVLCSRVMQILLTVQDVHHVPHPESVKGGILLEEFALLVVFPVDQGEELADGTAASVLQRGRHVLIS